MGNKRNNKKTRTSTKNNNLSRRSIIHRSAVRNNEMNFVPRANMPRSARACMYIYAAEENMGLRPTNVSIRNRLNQCGSDRLLMEGHDGSPNALDRSDSLSGVAVLTVANGNSPSDTLPIKSELPVVRSDSCKRRTVIIDGNDVALAHSLDQEFSVRGLEICINVINNMGYEAKAVVPINLKHPGMATDAKLLNELYAAGKIIYAPCRTIMDDDRHILQVARRTGGAVLSNDSYSKLYDESLDFREIIDNRKLSYCWIEDEMVILRDPYGSNGPTLYKILSRT